MNSRHKKTGDDRPGDNSPVCWPLIETEKQLRQVTEENGLLIGWVAMELTSTPAIHAMTRRTRSRRREPLARPDDAATSVQVGATHTAPSLTPAEPTAAHLHSTREDDPDVWNATQRARTLSRPQLLA